MERYDTTNTSRPLHPQAEAAVIRFLTALIDQDAARVIVAPKRNADGFWFGGGNMIESDDGALYLCGRYRNFGDSRTGLAEGERGLELAVFRSTDGAQSFEQITSLSKQDLSCGVAERGIAGNGSTGEGDEGSTPADGGESGPLEPRPGEPGRVLSIEGSCLVRRDGGWDLFVSSEKERLYPSSVAGYLKPGTGVWSIDRMSARTIGELSVESLSETLRSEDPEFLHVKDPFWTKDATGRGLLMFCTHPYNWSSSNTGYLPETPEGFGEPVYRFFERGSTWDVAITRGTCVLPLPKIGLLSDAPDLSVMFYDGGECLRKLDEHRQANKRPRGYSCEELGGAALLVDGDPAKAYRLSRLRPLFVSPWGTGSSRYVDVLMTADGYYATWEQSQEDGSQPLVMNFLSHEDTTRFLS